MREVGSFSNHCLKSCISPIRVILVLIGKLLSYLDVCSFFYDDKDPGVGKVHGVRGGGGGVSVRRGVVQVDGVVDVAVLGDVDEG